MSDGSRFRRGGVSVLTFIVFLSAASARHAQSAGIAGLQQSDLAPTPSAIVHHSAQANGVKYHYVVSGSGPAVVLLHGWPTTWYHWHRIIPKLAATYTVIAPDLRGLGLTERTDGGYDKRTVAEDIYQLVRHLGHERVYVVGHDIGGMVAFALAHEHPEIVEKLVILDVPIPGLGVWEQSLRRLWHLGFHQVPELPEALVSGNVRTYLQYFFTFNSTAGAITEEELTEYARAYSEPGALRAGFAYYRAFSEDAKTNEVYARTRLRMPVLALGGALTMGEGTLRQMQPVAENVQGGVLQQAGHWFAAEQPDELSRRLILFFTEP